MDVAHGMLLKNSLKGHSETTGHRQLSRAPNGTETKVKFTYSSLHQLLLSVLMFSHYVESVTPEMRMVNLSPRPPFGMTYLDSLGNFTLRPRPESRKTPFIREKS